MHYLTQYWSTNKGFLRSASRRTYNSRIEWQKKRKFIRKYDEMMRQRTKEKVLVNDDK